MPAHDHQKHAESIPKACLRMLHCTLAIHWAGRRNGRSPVTRPTSAGSHAATADVNRDKYAYILHGKRIFGMHTDTPRHFCIQFSGFGTSSTATMIRCSQPLLRHSHLESMRKLLAILGGIQELCTRDNQEGAPYDSWYHIRNPAV